MSNKILIINGGSSSIKYQLMEAKDFKLITSGICERIFVDGNFVNKTGNKKIEIKTKMKNHNEAFEFMVNFFIDNGLIQNIDEIIGVGHRVVHGGSKIKDSEVINKNVISIIKECIKFAPLHNEPELEVINVSMQKFKKATHVAVFDTSFHNTIPLENKRYAVPKEWEEKYGVIRYGMHGTSYKYITQEMSKILNNKKPNLIICHLGNGCSICSVKNGKSFNTSMGLTPLEGLIMGTRSGDIDPSIIEYICLQTKKDVVSVTSHLNKKSGMMGMIGMSDYRDIIKNLKKPDVAMAFKIVVNRIAYYILRYYNELEGKCDGLVFTAGIGENTPLVRQAIVDAIKIVKLKLDNKKNNSKFEGHKLISLPSSEVKIYVMSTNEELMIAKEVKRLLNKHK